MPLMDPARCALLVIDVQARLMPAIADAEAVVANVRRLAEIAALVGVPALFTEQNPAGLGPTLPGLRPEGGAAAAKVVAKVIAKTAFDATRAAGVLEALPQGCTAVLAGCEAHICVLQTALGLLAAGRRVCVARDAVGSRRAESREAGLARMAAHGAEVVTAEMAAFEWLGSADHPRFREVARLIR